MNRNEAIEKAARELREAQRAWDYQNGNPDSSAFDREQAALDRALALPVAVTEPSERERALVCAESLHRAECPALAPRVDEENLDWPTREEKVAMGLRCTCGGIDRAIEVVDATHPRPAPSDGLPVQLPTAHHIAREVLAAFGYTFDLDAPSHRAAALLAFDRLRPIGVAPEHEEAIRERVRSGVKDARLARADREALLSELDSVRHRLARVGPPPADQADALAAERRISEQWRTKFMETRDERDAAIKRAEEAEAVVRELAETYIANIDTSRPFVRCITPNGIPDYWQRAMDLHVAARIRAIGATSAREGRSLPVIKCHGLDTPERVCFYEHDFYPLSNFSAFPIRWPTEDYGGAYDEPFLTSEHVYHWEKFRFSVPEGNDIARRIRTGGMSAHDVFKLAEVNKEHRRKDWDAVKIDVMRRILRAKIEQHEYVKRKLLATGERELVEDSWRDDFWGWGPNRDGQNMLGKLWMELRAELRSRDGGEGRS